MPVYHVFSKSIAGFTIFNSIYDFQRIINGLDYYRDKPSLMRFSIFYAKNDIEKVKIKENEVYSSKEKLVNLIAYCIMPTHIHMVLEELKDKGISCYMGNILNSYTRYFNNKYKRRGPLWESRFKRVEVENDEQLMHLTRYIHLNPVTGYLVNRPEDWTASSYMEYISDVKDGFCFFNRLLGFDGESYKTFTEDQISYQRELAKIKNLIIE